MLPFETDVVVVGAGPTGLVAAARLAQLGADHVLLEAAAEPAPTSRAALVHAATLEILAELGAADPLVAAGERIRRIAVRAAARPLTCIDLTRLPGSHPLALGVPQSTTEQVLATRLGELGGRVLRGHRVVSVRPTAAGYAVAGVAGAVPFEITARYVVAADGAHSAVRAGAGIAFPGRTYPEQFVLADVALAPQPTPDEVRLCLSPLGVTVLSALPGGRQRIVATLDGDVPQVPDRAFLDALLQARHLDVRLAAEPEWSSRFRVHHRIAAQFRAGGVFLAGDAAHVHSPAAGQGMNIGIADAYDVATRLAAVLAGVADERVLDGYAQHRRRAAQEVLRFTDRMTRVALMRTPAARFVRRALAGTVGRLDPVRRRLAERVSGLRRSPLRGGLPEITPAGLDGLLRR